MNRHMLFLSHATVRNLLTMRESMRLVEETLRMQADPESIVWGLPLAYVTEDRMLGFKWRLKTVVLRQIPIA
ncbi:MAG: hypothetical protein A2W26_13355 [Acidobacteria bacterium RBG_16_64_8]|nr:MAG: hypothetical protein A2W26_13355 [Acidobacteria bacterium RBG_16_64_8]